MHIVFGLPIEFDEYTQSGNPSCEYDFQFSATVSNIYLLEFKTAEAQGSANNGSVCGLGNVSHLLLP